MENESHDARADDADPERTTSGSPHTVGAPNPGEPKAPRSSTSGAAHEPEPGEHDEDDEDDEDDDRH